MALKLGILTYQILTNDDEVCLSSSLSCKKRPQQDFIEGLCHCHSLLHPNFRILWQKTSFVFLLVNNIPNSFHSFLGRHFICCLHWYLRNFLRNMIPFIFFNRDSCLMLWAQIRSHAMFIQTLYFLTFPVGF